MAKRLNAHIWITKTGTSAEQRHIQGYASHFHPLLTVSPARTQPRPPENDDTLIFTSRNGVRAFCALTEKRDWSVYTVGDATAACAKEFGFLDVVSAQRDVEALGNLLIKAQKPRDARYYYASGQDISGDLVAVLRQNDFKTDRAIVYETNGISSIPEIQKVIDDGERLTIFLYSAKAAKVFASLELGADNIETISISRQVDENLDSTAIRSRYIAEHPTHASMIKQLR